uniref:Uncharacterized protein n=1 Tax=Avena sativa TaxID=4498 RepID=A0ACD5Z873_AVESA
MSTSASQQQQHASGGGGGCCSSGGTLELVAAFTAVCLALYGVILYLNYLYERWSGGRDGVHRRATGSGAAGGGGLDKAALAAMPVFSFKANEGAGQEECAVCLGAMQDGDAVRALPGCRHAFHVGCVDVWLCTHATCPVCRARPALPPPSKAGGKATDQHHGLREPDLESQV